MIGVKEMRWIENIWELIILLVFPAGKMHFGDQSTPSNAGLFSRVLTKQAAPTGPFHGFVIVYCLLYGVFINPLELFEGIFCPGFLISTCFLFRILL